MKMPLALPSDGVCSFQNLFSVLIISPLFAFIFKGLVPLISFLKTPLASQSPIDNICLTLSFTSESLRANNSVFPVNFVS